MSIEPTSGVILDRRPVVDAADSNGSTARNLAAEGGGEPAMKALDGKEPEPYIFEGRLILRYI